MLEDKSLICKEIAFKIKICLRFLKVHPTFRKLILILNYSLCNISHAYIKKCVRGLISDKEIAIAKNYKSEKYLLTFSKQIKGHLYNLSKS